MEKDSTIFDVLGISASLICILHCILSSMVLAFLPHFGQKLWNSEFAHQGLVLIAMFFCFASIYQGYKKNTDKKTLLLFLSGFICLFSSAFLLPEQLHEKYEIYILGSGGLALTSGHVFNFRRLCRCKA